MSLIRNIWCVGRNFADHAKELGNQVPKSPLIFLKAGSCAFTSPTVELPKNIGSVQFELEIALRFDHLLSIDAYCFALDLTDRENQTHAKTEGLPWTRSKSFKNACPISSFRKVAHLKELNDLEFQLQLNEKLTQQGKVSDMIFNPEFLVEYVKKFFPVSPGDLLLTGTPAGVTNLKAGDLLKAKDSKGFESTWHIL